MFVYFCRKKIKLDGFTDVWSSVCNNNNKNGDPNDIVAVEVMVLYWYQFSLSLMFNELL